MKREIRRVETLRRLADAFLAIGPLSQNPGCQLTASTYSVLPPPVSPSLAELS